jgi:hypothetical protein
LNRSGAISRRQYDKPFVKMPATFRYPFKNNSLATVALRDRRVSRAESFGRTSYHSSLPRLGWTGAGTRNATTFNRALNQLSLPLE